MTDFALAQSADGSPSLLAQACANQLRNVHGHNLGFIYVTAPLAGALQEIVGILKDRSSIKDWFGTVGFGICSTETEYFGRPAIVALTARLAKDSYRLVGPLADPSESLLEIDERFASALTDDERDLLFGVPVDEASLVRHYTLAPEDLEQLLAKRGARNALGAAVQLGLLRHPGFGSRPVCVISVTEGSALSSRRARTRGWSLCSANRSGSI